MLSTPVMKWTVVVVLLATLVGTHWWAYRLGAQAEHERTAKFVEGWYDADQFQALRDHVEVMTILAKHPQAFDWKDVEPYCLMSLALAKQIENGNIIPARETGDDPRADRLQYHVNEARRLVSLLTKGRR